MRKVQSPSSEDSGAGKPKDRSLHHHSSSVSSNNGTGSKKSENGSSSVQQRHRPKMQLENLTPPTGSSANGSDKPKPLILELIIEKDKAGYGMKVSGENPVFVDSVKDGGAAHRAGLNSSDMILRVNGHNVKSSSHAEVVQLMKATQNVELTVQRCPRSFWSPGSGGISATNLGTPTTPTSQRNSITAPLPVDHFKRKEVEYTKLHTLYMMLEQEKKNLEKLREHESQNGSEIAKAEANIRTLQDQLRASTNDSSTQSLMSTIISTAASKVTISVPTTVTAPTFLARFPRSLSQLNLGSKRKSSAPSPQEVSKPLPAVNTPTSSSSSSTPVSSPNHQQKVRVRHQHPTVTADVPPPLPQRNAPRKSLPTSPIATPQVSDLDASLMSNASGIAPFGSGMSGHNAGGAKQKKNKTKIKAYSDPKMSSEIMLQMECANYPPPLPPRQNLFDESQFGVVVANKDISDGSGLEGRPLPNSVATQLNYPVIATSVAVREGLPPNFHHHHHHSFDGGMTTSSCSLPDNAQSKAKKDGKHREGSGPEVSPPGTPPPPYHPNASNSTISAAQTNLEQRQILSFECDNETDEEPLTEDDSVFRSLSTLTAPENVTYLVVFLNFVLSNSKPAAILFYLITDLYKKGNVKDMRKWAYEIHSTFLVPTAPLAFFPSSDVQSESLARDVDDKLALAKNYQPQDRSNTQDFEMLNLLKGVFQKSRGKAKDIINRQMEEFQEKRTAGLGTMYGPSGPELAAAKGNKQMETKIVEDCLMPKLTVLLDECDGIAPFDECAVSSKMALTSALSTVVHKVFLPRGATAGNERVHHYVTREKSFKSRLISKNRKALVRGHHLSLRQYYETTHCNHCQNLIWGVAPQGFACADCGLHVHRGCAKLLEETCPGPVNMPVDKFTKFMDRIREKGHGMQNSKKHEDDSATPWDDAVTTDRSASFSARPKGDSQFQRPAQSSSSTSQLQSQGDSSQSDFHHQGSSSTITSSIGGSSGVIAGSPQSNQGADVGDHHTPVDGKRGKQKTAQPNARSESYKECSPKRSRTNRPKSDPSLYEDDVASSNDTHHDEAINTSTSTTPGRPHTGTSLDSSPATTDDESFRDMEGWNSEMIQQLTETEKKRQEIINELFETEKNHVKILKVLHNVFMVPLEQSKAMTSELIQMVFPPSLLVLKDWHNSFEATLKSRWKEHSTLVREIGDCLNVFDGTEGEVLKEHAARFCARQQIALEVLKERRKKDENLQRGLIKAESHKACRRLQLKDLLPAVLQRLTKYPLLFERLHKCSDGSDAEAIKRALDASKAILDYVNQAVRIAEELRSIQKKLDKASYEKEAPNEFKNIDLTNYKLIHDGVLTIKKGAITLRVLLFDNMIVLLQKLDDKYLLKQFAYPAAHGDNTPVNPITKICNLLVRLSAVDNRAFFLIDKENSHMLEMTAPSEQESEIWIRKITEAAEKANFLKKVQSKPLPAVPAPPPPPALEETPENLLDSPPEDPPAPSTDEPESPSTEKDEEPTQEPDEDPNATSSTQPCQLIQPSEICVTERDIQEASLVVTPEESLRRHGEQIQTSVTEMERIICDLNRVPPEHFAAIADIAAQPEAPSDLADLAIAAFAQSKFLVETLRTAMVNGVNSAPPSSFGGPALCDNCAGPTTTFRTRSASEPLAPSGGMELEAETDADNLYCEIEPLKENAGAKLVSHMEINENYSGIGGNSNGGHIRVEKIAASITTLNSLVSQLTIKIAERDHERDLYRRENQRLRMQLHMVEDEEIVATAVRDLAAEVCESDEQPES